MNAPLNWKKIIVPTDFSSGAEVALRTAADLRRAGEGEVVLLHVTEPVYEGLRVQTGGLHEQMRQEALVKIRELAETAFPNAHNVRAVVKDGRPADVICRTAAEEKADVIILPTHGHSGLKHVLLGSVAEKVVRHAPCSVLVVRPGKEGAV